MSYFKPGEDGGGVSDRFDSDRQQLHPHVLHHTPAEAASGVASKLQPSHILYHTIL